MENQTHTESVEAVIGHPVGVRAATPTQLRLAREHKERMERIRAAALRQSASKMAIFEQPRPAPVVVVPEPEPVKAPPSIDKQMTDAWRILNKHITVRDIQRLTAKHFGILLTELLSNRRAVRIVRPRQVAVWLACKFTSRSLPELGRDFGGKDHTTILHARRKIQHLIDTADDIAHHCEALCEEVGKLQEAGLA